MKTTVTTREFDDEARCVKETVTEYEHSPQQTYWTPARYPYTWPNPYVTYSGAGQLTSLTITQYPNTSTTHIN